VKESGDGWALVSSGNNLGEERARGYFNREKGPDRTRDGGTKEHVRAWAENSPASDKGKGRIPTVGKEGARKGRERAYCVDETARVRPGLDLQG